MKPDWKDAPEWANWLAMDKNGEWFWYEDQPEWWATVGVWMKTRNSMHVPARCWLDGSDSLEQRSKTTNPAEAGSEGQPGA